jgi:hypothetical protein
MRTRNVFLSVIVLAGSLALAGNALGDDEQSLGNLLFTDPNLSLNRNQS